MSRLENFLYWLWALTWSFLATVNASNAAVCRIEDRMGWFFLACAGSVFGIVNAMASFSKIKFNSKEKEDKRYE